MSSLTAQAATHPRNRVEVATYVRIGALASVCREWQVIIESATFRNLKVAPSDLESLREIISNDKLRRQYSIRELHFQVVLPEYERPPFVFNHTRRLGKEQAAFADAVSQLFNVLHDWDSSRVARGTCRGLALEVTVASPNDPDDPGGRDAYDPHTGRARFRFRPLSLPSETAASRPFKPVPVVTEFITGEPPCRNLHYQALATILGSFPNLRLLSGT
ncbi:hypothetical protein PG996_015400 [Apiospora saccharicola]|uniref:F-box domain-containing protein n=1 Tax=Apiospora saccharicola TaxID=335842 RepID=A0ABR1TL14_9PEZI